MDAMKLNRRIIEELPTHKTPKDYPPAMIDAALLPVHSTLLQLSMKH